MIVERPSRLLVLAPNWLGDAVMALPLLADVRRAWPETTIVVAGRRSVAALFRMVPGVDETITLDGGGGLAALTTWKRNAATLAQGGFDAACLLPNSFAAAWTASRANIPQRWGYATDWRSRLLTTAVRVFGRGLHQAAYYQGLGTALGFPAGPLHARVTISDEARASARALLSQYGLADEQRFVVMAPGAAYGRAKQWLPVRFAELATLLARDGVSTVLVGSQADAAVCAEIARMTGLKPGPTSRFLKRPSSQKSVVGPGFSPVIEDANPNLKKPIVGPGFGPVIDLSGKTDLPTLAGIVSLAHSVVANDSGAMHLAAAVGAKVVAVFGATDETRTSPLPAGDDAPPPVIVSTDVWCRPCMLRECPIDHRCMTGISAQRVFESL